MTTCPTRNGRTREGETRRRSEERPPDPFGRAKWRDRRCSARTLPGKWSILKCLEHLAVSEDYLFSQIPSTCRHDVYCQLEWSSEVKSPARAHGFSIAPRTPSS